MDPSKFISFSTLLYSLANPVGVIPIFLSMTGNRPNINRRRIIVVAATAVAALLVMSALCGQQLLAFFSVGLDDFRIAGGLLALFIAFEMFQARYSGVMQTTDEASEAELYIHSIAITPLAFPLLVGPAEMSVMMTLATERPSWSDKLGLAIVSIITATMIATTLLLASPINKLLGKTGINVATRVMALFVAASLSISSLPVYALSYRG